MSDAERIERLAAAADDAEGALLRVARLVEREHAETDLPPALSPAKLRRDAFALADALSALADGP